MFKKIRKKRKKTILLVEDDALLVDVLQKELLEAGFFVEKVTDGLDVEDRVKDIDPDIVLLDLVLPGMDGFEVLRLLKGDKKTSDIPVIVLSNLDKEADIKSTIALGAVEHLVKVDTQLDNVVRAVIRHIG